MSMTLTAEDMKDEFAITVAHVLASANRRAHQHGCDVSQSLVSITQHFNGTWLWRINYGAKNPTTQRGGDLIVEVNAENGEVMHVLHGQ